MVKWRRETEKGEPYDQTELPEELSAKYLNFFAVLAGDVLYELLQHILKQRKSHMVYQSAYFPGNSFNSLPESAAQHLKLEGQSMLLTLTRWFNRYVIGLHLYA